MAAWSGRKNVLATMMQSMVALAVVGVYWIVIGYALAFGDPWIETTRGSLLGFSPQLVFLCAVKPGHVLPGTSIPVYLHMLFQGMFAIITPALISGAVAERIRFKPYCIFLIVWVTFVYCPLAHCVWAMDWDWANSLADPATASAKAGSAGGRRPRQGRCPRFRRRHGRAHRRGVLGSGGDHAAAQTGWLS